MTFKYTKEHEDYIREIADGRRNNEITRMFNEKFGLNKSVTAIGSLKKRLGVSSNIKGPIPGRNVSYQKVHRDFIRQHARGRSNEELTNMFNKKFNTDKTVAAINQTKIRMGVKSGLTGHFPKGHKPWNKGMKGLNTGGEKGWFKKGQTPLNYRKIGSERVSKDGYIEVKVADPNKWASKHRILWEKENGAVPESHVVIFGDGDKRNFDMNNLILVSRSQLARLNQNDLIKNHADLTKIGISIADVYSKIGRLQK